MKACQIVPEYTAAEATSWLGGISSWIDAGTLTLVAIVGVVGLMLMAMGLLRYRKGVQDAASGGGGSSSSKGGAVMILAGMALGIADLIFIVAVCVVKPG